MRRSTTLRFLTDTSVAEIKPITDAIVRGKLDRRILSGMNQRFRNRALQLIALSVTRPFGAVKRFKCANFFLFLLALHTAFARHHLRQRLHERRAIVKLDLSEIVCCKLAMPIKSLLCAVGWN